MINQVLVREVTGEQENDKIYKLNLSGKSIEKISNLRPYEKIRCLILDFNYIAVIENINTLPDLRELHLQSNSIKKITGLQNNKQLNFLNLASNQIEKIENIAHLTRLQTLILNFNTISKLACLESLKDLKHLNVSNNNLTTIQSMPAFSKLETLDLSNNSITKISNSTFNSSNKLVKLNLSFNNLSETNFIHPLTNLENLDLSHNNLTKFEIDGVLKNLDTLNISSNSIQQLPYFTTIFPDLITLNLSNNYIGCELQLIESLANCSSLSMIDFRQNPMYSEQFQQTFNSMHKLDEINGKILRKAGSKYYDQIEQIHKQFQENPLIYKDDDEEDRKIKLSGFQSQKIEELMTGVKPNRPNSPTSKKTKLKTNTTLLDDIDKVYKQFSSNHKKIQELRQSYKLIFERNNIQQPIINEQTEQLNNFQIGSLNKIQTKGPSEIKKLKSIQGQIKKQNEQSINKWKQLKSKQKNFNIRDLIRKSSGRQKSSSKSKIQNQLFKTQVPQKWNTQLHMLKTLRPSSLKKKEHQ